MNAIQREQAVDIRGDNLGGKSDLGGDSLRCVSLQAPAKINLFLEVLGRRTDGYHDLATIMACVSLYDTLHFQPLPHATGQTELQIVDARRCGGMANCVRPIIPTGEANLAVRAVELVRRRVGIPHSARLSLTKRIPLEAGLGGGSSDAAAALHLANRGWHAGLSMAELTAMAMDLGSDVPYFLQRAPAICLGRGERVGSPLAIPAFPLVLAVPPVGLSTREIFANCQTNKDWDPNRLAPWTSFSSVAAIGSALFNRLQDAATQRTPWIERLLTEFRRERVLGACMTGSGSVCFGLCRTYAHARTVSARLARIGIATYRVHTLSPPILAAA